VIGGEASGKTSVARRIGAAIAAPIHSLDDVAWIGVGSTTWELFSPDYMPSAAIAVRPSADRAAIILRIADRPLWVTEGKHVGWTEPLLDAADVIVWLDHVPFHVAAWRIVRRAARSGVRSVRSGPRMPAAARGRGYVTHAVELAMQLARLARFFLATSERLPPADAYGRITRASIRGTLRPYAAKVIRVRTRHQLSRLLRTLADRSLPAEDFNRAS
jgi:hypothetical protein